MRIAYGKLGSTLSLDEPSNVQGDVEVLNLLDWLVKSGHQVDLVTPTRGEPPTGVVSQFADGGAFSTIPKLTMNDRNDLVDGGIGSTEKLRAFESELNDAAHRLPDYDDWIIWLGEHNGPCWPIIGPRKGDYVRPYLARINLVWPTINAVNTLQVKPLFLCPDPRNILSCNNLDPSLADRPILAQRNEKRKTCGREEDVEYVYAGLELLAIAHLNVLHGADRDRIPFGAMVNEGSQISNKLARKNLVKPWILDLGGELVGNWRTATCEELGIPEPPTVPVYEVMDTVTRWKSTITLPASATGWATAKPWESFVAGTVCFAHPLYDDQDNVYRWFDPTLRRFLRPADPATLAKRIDAVDKSEALRHEVVEAQRHALIKARRTLADGSSQIENVLGRQT